MWILKNIFRLREKAYDRRREGSGGVLKDDEKPFLDHLEDLRKMLFKILITLLIAMVGAFVFDKELLSIIRYPVELAGIEHNDGENLPDEIRGVDWIYVKKIADEAGTLAGQERAAMIKWAAIDDPTTRAAIEGAISYRNSLILDGQEARIGYVTDIFPEDSLARTVAIALLERNKDAQYNEGGDLLRMTALGPAETFNLSIKLSFFAGIIIAFPFLFFFVAEFVMPGLTPKERRMIWPACAIGFGLFALGVLFAYFIVLPRALNFFTAYSDRLGVISDWRIGYYVSFVTQFTLIFGACFELPVVVITLVKIGLLQSRTMRDTRSYAVLIIFVLAAVITPTTDALTLLLLAGPMTLLYEICIWLAVWIERKNPVDDVKASASAGLLENGLLGDRTDRLLGNPDDDGGIDDDYDPYNDTDDYDPYRDTEDDDEFPDPPVEEEESSSEPEYPWQAEGTVPFGDEITDDDEVTDKAEEPSDTDIDDSEIDEHIDAGSQPDDDTTDEDEDDDKPTS